MADSRTAMIRLRQPGQAGLPLRKLLDRYATAVTIDSELRFEVPVNLANGLVRIFNEVESVPETEPAPPCDGCWELPVQNGFHNHQSLRFTLDGIAAANPGRVDSFSIGRSYEGRDLLAGRINASTKGPGKKVLLVGCHHAREWLSVEVVLRLFASVVDGSSGIAAGRVDGLELWAVPMLNPDGHDFSVEYEREWRKSRSAIRTSNGFLHHGVDLNRNYCVGFGRGSSAMPSDDEYRGPGAFSEPETKAMRELCLAQEFDGILSFHASGKQILYPWGFEPPAHSGREIDLVRCIAASMGTAIRDGGGSYAVLQTWNHYGRDVGGDFCDWAFHTFRKPALTVELGRSDFGWRLPSALIGEAQAEFSYGFKAFIEAL